MNKIYQQGDVLFVPRADNIPENTEVKKDMIVAEGEVTGHMHEVISPDATVYVDKEGNIFLDAEKGATVTHQEHHKVDVPPGKYDIKIVREYDPLENEVREVRD